MLARTVPAGKAAVAQVGKHLTFIAGVHNRVISGKALTHEHYAGLSSTLPNSNMDAGWASACARKVEQKTMEVHCQV